MLEVFGPSSLCVWLVCPKVSVIALLPFELAYPMSESSTLATRPRGLSHLHMKSNASGKSTNNCVASRFLARTHSMIRRILRNIQGNIFL